MNKWYRSLQWRLQAWHALILLTVVLGFGCLLHWEYSRSQMDSIDEELVSAARVIEGSLRLIPKEVVDSLAQDMRYPPGPRMPPPRERPPRPPRRNRAPNNPPEQNQPQPTTPQPTLSEPRETSPLPTLDTPAIIPDEVSQWESRLRLPESLPQPIGRSDTYFFYVVWREDGSVLQRSALPMPLLPPPEHALKQLERDRYVATQRDVYRETFVKGPHNTVILVGRSIQGEMDRNRARQAFLFLGGMSTLLLGLAGGWWMSRSAIRPILQMSKTAAGIGATNLSERIQLNGFDNELAELGTILNGMLARLDESFQQQQQFTADASHELRTPLASLLANSELALGKDREPHEYKRFMETNRQTAIRMQRMVDALLVLARLDAALDDLSMSMVDLDKLLRTSCDRIQSVASELSIQIHLDTQPCRVPGNELSLERAMENLIHNAIQYNRPGGSVWISLSLQPTEVVVEIRDDGLGIAKEDQEKIFGRFFRADKSRAQNRAGCGLGLAIVRRIIDVHNGTIEVSSDLQRGSTFRVRLPIGHTSSQSKLGSA